MRVVMVRIWRIQIPQSFLNRQHVSITESLIAKHKMLAKYWPDVAT